MPSDTVVAGNTTSRSESNVSPTVSGSPTAKLPYSTRLLLACPRVLLLGLCLVYLSAGIWAVNTGFSSIHNFMVPRHSRAVDAFQLLSTAQSAEQILYGRLDKLLSTQLSRGFMETHEDCLIRGLGTANKELLGLGLLYTDIREQVMDWTMENCGRLQHTPQAVVQDPSAQQAVLTYWADMNYRSRRLLEGALGAVRQQACWVWHHLLSAISKSNASTVAKPILANADTNDKPAYNRHLANAPSGFVVRCEPSQSCRLIYRPDSSLRPDRVSISSQDLAKMERRISELAAFRANLRRGISVTRHSVSVLDTFCITILGVQIGLVLVAALYMAATHEARTTAATRPARVPHSIIKMDKYMVGLVGMCYFMSSAYHVGVMYPEHLPHDEPLVLFGLLAVSLGVSMLFQFFLVRYPNHPDVVLFCGLVKKLYFIIQGFDLPGQRYIYPEPSPEIGVDTKNSEPKAMEDLPTDAKSYSSDHGEQNQSREEHKTQHDVQPDVNSDIDTESDTDSDTEPEIDHSAFVDLAGGITPQMTDVESGWSMVDA